MPRQTGQMDQMFITTLRKGDSSNLRTNYRAASPMQWHCLQLCDELHAHVQSYLVWLIHEGYSLVTAKHVAKYIAGNILLYPPLNKKICLDMRALFNYLFSKHTLILKKPFHFPIEITTNFTEVLSSCLGSSWHMAHCSKRSSCSQKFFPIPPSPMVLQPPIK